MLIFLFYRELSPTKWRIYVFCFLGDELQLGTFPMLRKAGSAQLKSLAQERAVFFHYIRPINWGIQMKLEPKTVCEGNSLSCCMTFLFHFNTPFDRINVYMKNHRWLLPLSVFCFL